MSRVLGAIGLHVVAAASAAALACRAAPALGAGPLELLRMASKSMNLGLCYVGFCNGRLSRGVQAGKAAFLCAAYDYATDWPGAGDERWRRFEGVLASLVAEPLVEVVRDLRRREIVDTFALDGLYRGPIALRFVSALTGATSELEQLADLEQLGIQCQIADDILDADGDQQSGDVNCLASPRRSQYLQQFVRGMAPGETRRIFGSSWVMRWVLRCAWNRARSLLALEGHYAA